MCVCVCESDRNQKIDNSEAKNVKIERKGKKGEKNPQPETVSESLKVCLCLVEDCERDSTRHFPSSSIKSSSFIDR